MTSEDLKRKLIARKHKLSDAQTKHNLSLKNMVILNE
jgi:hypothetical protein